jgi:hypothetical protein
VPADSVLPGQGQRLRCTACGNLTRFDVVSHRRTSAYWHYSLAGELTVESEQELASGAELLRCRWCGSEHDVEVVAAPGAESATEAAGPQAGAERTG